MKQDNDMQIRADLCAGMNLLHMKQEGWWLWIPVVTSAVWMEHTSLCPHHSHKVRPITHTTFISVTLMKKKKTLSYLQFMSLSLPF